MLYSPKSIANFFLDLAKASGQTISPMKLQKLVYYAHGWYAGHTRKPLINESVEAWQYGPVIPSLYHEFKRFGSGDIKSKATELDWDDGKFKEVAGPQEPQMRKFLENVWNSYGQYSGIKLSELTHAHGSPWDQTWKKLGGEVRGADIPFEVIAEHFSDAVATAKQRAGSS